MRARRSIAWFLRVLSLFGLLVWTALLYQWSQRDDPRFYDFLQSGPGRVTARVFRWHGQIPDVPEADKKESELTAKELATKRKIEAAARAEKPAHQLEFFDGELLTGKVVEETADTVVFEETYGASGGFSVTLPRARIKTIIDLTNSIPEITYRDVRFQMEYPAMTLYRRPPYTIVTDESFFRVSHIVDALLRLHAQFIRNFDALISDTSRRTDIQVLFFSKEDEFRVYQHKYAPQMVVSAGFYSPWVDRLAVFNQAASEQVRGVREHVDREEQSYRATYSNNPAALSEVTTWRADTERKIVHMAEQQTMATVRHEGAHQLMFDYGVHSKNMMESDWLIEGLATWCETPIMGEKDPVRVLVLKEAMAETRLIPLEELVNSRSEKGLLTFGSAKRVELAYCQSWALVRYLMAPERRDRFYEFIRHVRDRENYRKVKETPAMVLLCGTLGMSAEELGAEWEKYLRDL